MDVALQSRAEQLAQDFAAQASTAEDLGKLMRLMVKSALERMLDTKMDVHLGRRARATSSAVLEPPGEAAPTAEPAVLPPGRAKRAPNRRNGRSRKTIQGDLGELTLSTPRDRDGSFEPLVIGKHQRRLPGFDEKILALYAKG